MRQILKRIVETLVVIFGNCIYAFGIAMFILTNSAIPVVPPVISPLGRINIAIPNA